MVEAEPELGAARRQERVRKEEVRDDGRGSVGWWLRTVGRQALKPKGGEKRGPIECLSWHCGEGMEVRTL